jgi:hypothetical protein
MMPILGFLALLPLLMAAQFLKQSDSPTTSRRGGGGLLAKNKMVRGRGNTLLEKANILLEYT